MPLPGMALKLALYGRTTSIVASINKSQVLKTIILYSLAPSAVVLKCSLHFKFPTKMQLSTPHSCSVALLCSGQRQPCFLLHQDDVLPSPDDILPQQPCFAWHYFN